MADYIINVGVEVEDSALNTLETRINSLKEKHIKLGVELGNTKQLTKNAQTAVKTISKATAKAAKNTPVIKGSNLVEQMVDPEKALKSMANTASKLSKYQGKLDLGEVKLSVNQGIMGELDGLLAKLNEIKSTAKNMGSIKLTVGDNIKTKDGKIVVGETTSSMDLVDKMNLIGNNYAISTDGIATALQDSGSALVAAGNDFDKSVALVTAANSVVQDPSKVGAGLRTIALRLRGTSAEELSSMGEDTEGLVETTSKLNSNIKSLTAVNGKAGVSILDMNGNYRDTYDILKDISQVWDDIGKQDLADGQNRQAALLEMMAGKNRSNILASILQHPELLTDVYNDSANNYQNSAQNELNTYLDSIEAKTTKIKESWSQLWQSEGSTNTFKGLLDIGNGAVGLLNGLGLNKSLAGVGGMLVSHAMNWGGTNYQLVL